MTEGAGQSTSVDGRPFWSVMIPCWNPDPVFLAETLHSVLAAGIAPTDMQIALVDDASPGFDGARFLKESGFDRVEFHRAERHGGIGVNWNRCLHLARGEWVHILHQDDRVRPGFYAAMAAGVAREPAIAAAFCQHVFIDEAGTMLREGHMPPRPAGILDEWLSHVFVNLTIQCAAIVLRRSAVQRLGGFDADLSYALDWDLWQRLALAFPIWYEPQPLAEQRLHRRSQSKAVQATKWRELALVAHRVDERLDPLDAELAKPWMRQALLRMALRQARAALAAGEFRAAVREALGGLGIARPHDFRNLLRGIYPGRLGGQRLPLPAIAPAGQTRRILMIGGTSEPGGLHIHTAEVALALAESGLRVKILNIHKDFFSQLVAGSAVLVQTAPAPDLSPRLAVFLGWWRLMRLYRGWDVVLCRGSAGDTPPIALLALRLRARRLFTIEHGQTRQGPVSGLRNLRRHLSGRLIHRAIAVSEQTKRGMVESGFLPPGKIAACLNWVQPVAFAERPGARERRRRELGLAEGAVAIGYLGRLAPLKRLDVLIAAFAALGGDRDLRLVLLGDGWKRDELEAQCRTLGVAERVIFAGWQADPVDSLLALDIFILPSLMEGFPLSLLEAMAAGKVSLAHRMDSAFASIEDGSSGLIGDFSTEAGVAQGLERALAMSAADRAAMGERAKARVSAFFSRHQRLPAVLEALEAPQAAKLAALPSRDAEASLRHFSFRPDN